MYDSPHSQLQAFASCVWEPADIIEIRRLPSRRSTWVPAGRLADHAEQLQEENDAGENLYAGVNPRSRIGGTRATDVDVCRVLVADFDHEPDVEECRRRWCACGLPAPTLIIASGHGYHLYLRLADPIGRADWTALQKLLSELVRSDATIHDAPRILRLPGFTNHKPPATAACIVEADPSRVYAVAALAEMFPDVPSVPSAPRPAADLLQRARACARTWSGDRKSVV